MGVLLPTVYPIFLSFLLFAATLRETSAATVLWTAPAILLSAVMIAWAAEASQYFVAQGFALAILAWLQTLPEFAVEAVLAWHKEEHLLLANLTGALRLLLGAAWPLIYLTAAYFHRRRGQGPLRKITLDDHHAVEIVGLLLPLLYMPVVALKGTLTIYDGAVLMAMYIAYLIVLSKLPAEDHEEIEDLESVPKAIVLAPRTKRILAIAVLFSIGGFLIYLSAEPFLASLLALATVAGMPEFVFVQWIAPLVSEFPELASTLYWARREGRARMSLMNVVSSNINQWTMLTAMLPVVYSISFGTPTPIHFDQLQTTELWLTYGQAVIGLIFLVNMELAWWEATVLAVLFLIPFVSKSTEVAVTYLYFVWAGIEIVRMIIQRRVPRAFPTFLRVWREHVA
jgi:cation:H+ antiporter